MLATGLRPDLAAEDEVARPGSLRPGPASEEGTAPRGSATGLQQGVLAHNNEALPSLHTRGVEPQLPSQAWASAQPSNAAPFGGCGGSGCGGSGGAGSANAGTANGTCGGSCAINPASSAGTGGCCSGAGGRHGAGTSSDAAVTMVRFAANVSGTRRLLVSRSGHVFVARGVQVAAASSAA